MDSHQSEMLDGFAIQVTRWSTSVSLADSRIVRDDSLLETAISGRNTLVEMFPDVPEIAAWAVEICALPQNPIEAPREEWVQVNSLDASFSLIKGSVNAWGIGAAAEVWTNVSIDSGDLEAIRETFSRVGSEAVWYGLNPGALGEIATYFSRAAAEVATLIYARGRGIEIPAQVEKWLEGAADALRRGYSLTGASYNGRMIVCGRPPKVATETAA